MRRRAITVLVLLTAIAAQPAGAGEPWPHARPMPDEIVQVRPSHYTSVTAGLKSYRPVEPMPWADVNKRVAPRGSVPPSAPPSPGVTPIPPRP